MDEKKLKEAISELRKNNKKKFTQTVDLIINLKNLDLKNPSHQVEFFLEFYQIKRDDLDFLIRYFPEELDIEVKKFKKFNK